MSGAATMMEIALTSGVTTRRIAGWFVDAVIIGFALALTHLLLWIVGFLTFGLGWFLAGGLWVIPLAYMFFFISTVQATPGQAIAGLRVVRDEDLGPPTPAQALVYAAGFELTMWLGAVWLAAAFFTRRARCLHDIVAGVTVVRASALPVPAAPWTMAGGYPGR